MSAPIKALDLFAGTGWGVACKRLGIKEMGVEIMPEAVETRKANGMFTIYNDVWDGLLRPEQVPAISAFLAAGGTLAEAYDILIASPPCQTFSMAGHGAGRKALDEVIEAIELHAYKDPQALIEFGEKHDMRTALVLTPLAHVWRDRPRLVAFEQVPTVLPVWEACAEIMRELGYSVKTAVLQAEQYGVPQTRKRAILVARLDGEVQLPIPTHSAYYPTNPSKLDPGVKKWVTMAEALGWTAEEAEGSTYTGNNKLAHQAVRALDQPAPTVTAGHDSGNRGFIDADGQFFKATVEQVSALQSYPTAVKNMGKGMVERYGDRPGRAGDQPAFTIRASAGGTEPGGFVFRDADGETRKLEVEEVAALQTYPSMLRSNYGTGGDAAKRGERTIDQPSATLTSKADRMKWDGVRNMNADEAATLQTYERPFEWRGSMTKQFLQIGNAVPPLLAQVVLAELLKPAAALPVAEPLALDLLAA